MKHLYLRNTLLRQLFLAKWIGEYDSESGYMPPTGLNIGNAYGVDSETIQADVDRLRGFGMEIYRHSTKGYVCSNWPDVKAACLRWLRREIDREEELIDCAGSWLD